MTDGLRGPNWLKGSLWLEGEADTELSTSTAKTQRQSSKGKLLSADNMKATLIATVTLLVLALGWTTESVQVEVSAQLC